MNSLVPNTQQGSAGMSSFNSGVHSSRTMSKMVTKREFVPPKYPAIIVTSDFDADHIKKL